jgi:hypothetical protein
MSGIIEKLKHPLPLPAVLTVGKSNRSDAMENLNALQVSTSEEAPKNSPENSVQSSDNEAKTSDNEAQDSDVEKTPQLGPTHPSSPNVLSEFPPFEPTAPLDPT